MAVTQHRTFALTADPVGAGPVRRQAVNGRSGRGITRSLTEGVKRPCSLFPQAGNVSSCPESIDSDKKLQVVNSWLSFGAQLDFAATTFTFGVCHGV